MSTSVVLFARHLFMINLNAKHYYIWGTDAFCVSHSSFYLAFCADRCLFTFCMRICQADLIYHWANNGTALTASHFHSPKSNSSSGFFRLQEIAFCYAKPSFGVQMNKFAIRKVAQLRSSNERLKIIILRCGPEQ